MYHWIESIALEDGELKNLTYHQKRLEHTMSFFNGTVFSLRDVLTPITCNFHKGLFKVRIVYSTEQIIDISVNAYIPKELSTFQIIECSSIEYSFKNEDRKNLNSLKEGIRADEIIITKNGLITDTSYSNLVFCKADNWFTPTTYLLAGTQRQALLDKGIIKEAKLSVDNLTSFSHFKLINSMLDFHRSPSYPISAISR